MLVHELLDIAVGNQLGRWIIDFVVRHLLFLSFLLGFVFLRKLGTLPVSVGTAPVSFRETRGCPSGFAAVPRVSALTSLKSVDDYVVMSSDREPARRLVKVWRNIREKKGRVKHPNPEIEPRRTQRKNLKTESELTGA
jgi:hypothetical protein